MSKMCKRSINPTRWGEERKHCGIVTMQHVVSIAFLLTKFACWQQHVLGFQLEDCKMWVDWCILLGQLFLGGKGVTIYTRKSRKEAYEGQVSKVKFRLLHFLGNLRIWIGNVEFAIFSLYFLEEFLIVTAKKSLSLVQVTRAPAGRSLLGWACNRGFL